jgi:beta-fructofuranosidase
MEILADDLVSVGPSLLRRAVGGGKGWRLELWARSRSSHVGGRTAFEVTQGGRRVYAIAHLPPYFEHFAFTHFADEPLELIWDPSAIDVSFAYHYRRDTVAEEGVTFLDFSETGVTEWPMAKWPELYARESRPALRYSPFGGWMNDPNGLCRVDDRYHLFYQFHPNGTDWGPMHWGHAVSRDLYHWVHYPVFLEPQHNLAALEATGGAFSGSAFSDGSGEVSFYYTERLPAYDLFEGYKEVQRRAVPSADMLEPVANRLVLSEGAPGTKHDSRDPKVWFDAEAHLYRMVLGASIEGDPAILLHSSTDGLSWSFTSVLYRAPAHFRQGGARCAECPDFFEVDDHWVLIAGFVGYAEAETRRHNLIYAITGSFADGVFTPYSDALQELDFGTDFYAMQSFRDGGRQLALAWLFNWEFRKPPGSTYSGEMSLPRVLGVDAERRLTMLPEPGYRRLRADEIVIDKGAARLDPMRDPIELELGGNLAGLVICIAASNGGEVEIAERDGRLHMRAPEDDGTILYRSAGLELSDLRLFVDAGVIELFANAGAVCGTRRSYAATDVARLTVSAPGPFRARAWRLRSVWVDNDAS